MSKKSHGQKAQTKAARQRRAARQGDKRQIKRQLKAWEGMQGKR